MASVAELGADLISVAPVKGRFGSTGKEVGLVGSQSNRCNRSHNFGLRLNVHAYSVDLGDTAITSTDEHVTVLKDLEDIDTLLEETLGWANSLVELTNKVNLNNVSGEGTEVSTRIVRVDFNALVFSLDLTSVDVLETNLLCNEVAGPDSDAVIVDSDELVVGAVEELNLVGDIHTDIVSADSFSGLNLF